MIALTLSSWIGPQRTRPDMLSKKMKRKRRQTLRFSTSNKEAVAVNWMEKAVVKTPKWAVRISSSRTRTTQQAIKGNRAAVV